MSMKDRIFAALALKAQRDSLLFDDFNQFDNWLIGSFSREDGKLPKDLYQNQRIYFSSNNRGYYVETLPITSHENLREQELPTYSGAGGGTSDYNDLDHKPITNVSSIEEINEEGKKYHLNGDFYIFDGINPVKEKGLNEVQYETIKNKQYIETFVEFDIGGYTVRIDYAYKGINPATVTFEYDIGEEEVYHMPLPFLFNILVGFMDSSDKTIIEDYLRTLAFSGDITSLDFYIINNYEVLSGNFINSIINMRGVTGAAMGEYTDNIFLSCSLDGEQSEVFQFIEFNKLNKLANPLTGALFVVHSLVRKHSYSPVIFGVNTSSYAGFTVKYLKDFYGEPIYDKPLMREYMKEMTNSEYLPVFGEEIYFYENNSVDDIHKLYKVQLQELTPGNGELLCFFELGTPAEVFGLPDKETTLTKNTTAGEGIKLYAVDNDGNQIMLTQRKYNITLIGNNWADNKQTITIENLNNGETIEVLDMILETEEETITNQNNIAATERLAVVGTNVVTNEITFYAKVVPTADVYLTLEVRQ